MISKTVYITSQILVLVITTASLSILFSVHYNSWPLYFGYGAALIAPIFISFLRDRKLFNHYLLIAGAYLTSVLFELVSEVVVGPEKVHAWSNVTCAAVFFCLWALMLFTPYTLLKWLSFSIGIVGVIGLQIYGSAKMPYMFGLIQNLIFFAMATLPIVSLLDTNQDDEADQKEAKSIPGLFEQRAA